MNKPYLVNCIKCKKTIQKYFNYEITATDVIKWCDDRKSEISRLNDAINKKDTTIDNLNNQIKDLEKDKNTLSDELKVCQNQIDANKDCPNKLLEQTQIANQANLDLEKLRGEYQIKEQGYIKQIKTMQTKIDGYKQPIKSLIVDIWSSIFNK